MENEIIITIPEYIRKVLLSTKRNKKYYEKGKKKIPKKYENNKEYGYMSYKAKTVLCNRRSGEPVIANPRTVGTPKYKVINGQSIYNGQIQRFERAVVIDAIKASFRPYLKEVKTILQYPIKITYTFEDDFLGDGSVKRQDLDNHAYLYGKCFQDLLTEKGIIRDDSVEYVNGIEYIYKVASKRSLQIKITY
jgi:Holliday junction resolvase RusA-like endonuclease